MKKLNLISELITQDNIKQALHLQHAIFPREDAEQNYFEAIEQNLNSDLPRKYQYEYFIVKDGEGEIIGLWGHYIEGDLDECWLGWYGVREDKRNHGYGTEIFRMFENWAKENGFKVIRLYTDDIDNACACKLYEKMGMTKELYKNNDDVTTDIGNIVIYSKALTNEPLTLWNNRFLNYRGQREREHNKGKIK